MARKARKKTHEDLYLILVWDSVDEVYRDTGEGPWNDSEQALDFAKAEVGLPWVMVRIDAADSGLTVSRLASRNLPLPGQLIQQGGRK